MGNLITKVLFGANKTGNVGRGTWWLLGGCGALLAWKAWAIWRLNVNWDEFYFLTHVHALVRGDLDLLFQTVFAQVFRWLTWIPGAEMAQIHVGRLCMFALLVLAAAQILRLAARWLSFGAAVVTAIAFLCTMPLLRYGASFRADSLMLPVLLGALLVCTRSPASHRDDVVAGLLCGVGVAISVKMVLFAPLLAVCVLLGREGEAPVRALAALQRGLAIAGVTLLTAAVLIGLHKLTLSAPVQSAAAFAGESLTKTVLETRFVPGRIFLRGQLRADHVIWIMMGAGALLALWQRRWIPLAMALSLLPLLFYRNTYPYFYVLMLAPSIMLVGQLVDGVRALARRGASATDARPDWVPVAFGGLLLVLGGARLPLLSDDEQHTQAAVLDAVHVIFPAPVPYVDHSGMVSSFRKVNFFMSTWGLDWYRRRGQSFVAPALKNFNAPLFIANRSYLDPDSPDFTSLLPEDRALIVRSYQPYWGPIYIAGARVELSGTESRHVELPFPGRYRLWSTEPLSIDGVVLQPGDVLEVSGASLQVARTATASSQPLTARLLWAEAGAPPPADKNYTRIYSVM
jgi:hypothetical protein